MTKRSTDDWHGCPIRYGAAIFGDHWCLLILRDLIFKGARYYADFVNADEGISTNILAARLVKLEDERILQKRPDPEHGKRFVYTLTNKGFGLIPAMLEIIDWAEVWDDQTEVPPEFATKLRQNRAALARKIAKDLRRSST